MGSKRRLDDRPIGRRGPLRAPLRRILIVCEGRETERRYFEAFQHEVRNPRVHVEIARQTGVPKTVVKDAISLREQASEEARRQRDENLLWDDVWGVFDVDDHPGLNTWSMKFTPRSRQQQSLTAPSMQAPGSPVVSPVVVPPLLVAAVPDVGLPVVVGSLPVPPVLAMPVDASPDELTAVVEPVSLSVPFSGPQAASTSASETTRSIPQLPRFSRAEQPTPERTRAARRLVDPGEARAPVCLHAKHGPAHPRSGHPRRPLAGT